MERLQNAPPETPGHSMKRPLAIPQGDANKIIPGTPTEDRMPPQKRPKTTKPPESTKRLDVVRRHMQPPSQATEVSFQPLVQDLEAEGQLSLQISPSVQVPYLKHTIKQVIQHILRQPDEFKGVPYAQAIEASGGVEAMTEELLKCIFDDIKKLQGEHITIDRLRQIRDNQLPHIAEYIQNSSGYLDFITDKRCGSYWRGYVGQSDELLRRIVDHINAIKQGQDDTLHYHVVWKGQGHRSANFIMLWKIVDSLAEDKVLLTVSNNVLEMVMCRIFQTLPPNTLERYSGARTQTEPYSTLGLNIVPPTLQSIPLSSSEKTGFISELTESSDPDIQEWPLVREATKKLARSAPTSRPSLTSEACHSALVNAVASIPSLADIRVDMSTPIVQGSHEPDFWDIFLSYLQDELDNVAHPILPVGCPDTARIGMMLDNWLSLDLSKSQEKCMRAPWGVAESGFNDANSLIWMYDFRNPSLLSVGLSGHSRAQTIRELDKVRSVNSFLISKSSLRVVLLFGGNAHQVIRGQGFQAIELQLPVGIFDAYVEIDMDSIKRIYINCPAPISSLAKSKYSESSKIAELFRFAALVTETPGISAYFSQNCGMVSYLLRSYENERNGAEKITGETMKPVIRNWLYRKGFTEQHHIDALEALGESLIHSCILLLHVLPRCPAKHRGTVGEHGTKRSKRQRRNMTVETEAVSQLYERITGKSQTVAPSTSADTSESNYVPDVGEATEAPSSKDPDYVPNLGDIIEELLVTQQDDVENFETPLRPETAELLIGGTTRSFRSAHMLKASGDDTRERVIQGILYSKSVTERGPIHITFPRQIRILVESGPDWDYQILVQAEVVPKGMRHTQSWARKAIIGDPARRLALKVTFQPLETINDPVVTYPVNNGEYSVYLANSFVDWLEGKSDEDIANTPRRFLVIYGMSERVPENLRYFRGGGYTDENMRRFKLSHGKGRVYDN